jgi:hypothetical protein
VESGDNDRKNPAQVRNNLQVVKDNNRPISNGTSCEFIFIRCVRTILGDIPKDSASS